jgi:hypothetical protein
MQYLKQLITLDSYLLILAFWPISGNYKQDSFRYCSLDNAGFELQKATPNAGDKK